MSGFLPVLVPMIFAGLATACLQLLQRWVLKPANANDQPLSPLPFLAVSQGILLVLMVAVYLARWGVTLPPNLAPGFWNAIALGTLANFGVQYLNAKAKTYAMGEVSLVAPLAAMTPGLITLMAITLGEFPGPGGIVGVTLMVVGSWVLLSPKNIRHWTDYLGPIYRLKLTLRYSSLSVEDKERAKVIWLVLGSAALASIGLLASGLYVRRGGDIQGWWLAAMMLWATLTFVYSVPALLRSKKTQPRVATSYPAKFLAGAALTGVLILVVTYCEYPLYFDTYVAYVGTLKRLSILFAVVFGYLIFREQDIKKRFLAALLIVVGALLIASEDLPARLTDKLQLFGF